MSTDKEIAAIEEALKDPAKNGCKSYSVFRFFWPFLIYADVGALLCAWLAAAAVATRGGKSDDITLAFVVTAWVVLVAVIFIGSYWASRKSSKMNAALRKDFEQDKIMQLEQLEGKRKALTGEAGEPSGDGKTL